MRVDDGDVSHAARSVVRKIEYLDLEHMISCCTFAAATHYDCCSFECHFRGNYIKQMCTLM